MSPATVIRHFGAPTIVFTIGVIACLGLTTGLATPAAAQQRIAAVVNDEVISQYDVDARLNIIIGTSNLEDTPEARHKLTQQVLRRLIEEKLKLQEARALKLTITDADVRTAVASVEKLNGLPAGGFEQMLTSRNLDPTAAQEQIRAEVAWVKVIQRTIRPQVKVGEDEIDAMLARIEAHAGRPSHRLSEIFLAVDHPSREEEVSRLADRLAEQIRAGADFRGIARQFSQSPSAASGGQLGWTPQGQLDAELEQVVVTLRPGDLSAPIRTLTGYYLLFVHERRVGNQVEAAPARAPAAGAARKPPTQPPAATRPAARPAAAPAASAQAVDGTVKLTQLFLPLQGPRKVSTGERDKAFAAAGSTGSCRDLEELGRKLKTDRSGSLGELRIKDLPTPLRGLVASLPLNSPSQPVVLADGIAILMVCDRKLTGGAQAAAAAPPPPPTPPPAPAPPPPATAGPAVEEEDPVPVAGGGTASGSIKLPSRADIARRLEAEKMEMLARRKLRDMRRAAFVDVRM